MRQRGFTLVETLIAIVVVGIVTGIALPRFRSASTKNNVRGSRNTLAALYAQARLSAVQQRRSTAVRLDGNRAFVTAQPRLVASGLSQYDTIGVVRDLGLEFGVALNATPASTPITINPKGLTLNAGTIRTSKGGYTDSLQVDRYGRMRK